MMHCESGNSNKVWGYFSLNYNSKELQAWGTPVFVFWGASGKALQIKEHILEQALISLQRGKERKNYKFIDEGKFLGLCPNFYQEVDDKLTFAILAGNKYKSVV
jgi:hypothetical protein